MAPVAVQVAKGEQAAHSIRAYPRTLPLTDGRLNARASRRTALFTALLTSVVLDALEALREHLDALVLVGAQAIYVYTGDADVAIATTTKDSDLLVNPIALEPEPRLEEAMTAANFHPNLERAQPGEWISEWVPVDLLVPESLGGAGTRAARIPPHDKMAARKVEGLEAAILDNELRVIGSLDPDRDNREFEIRVAGPSALLVAKLHKIGEREERGQVSRLDNKDAHDVYRLLRA